MYRYPEADCSTGLDHILKARSPKVTDLGGGGGGGGQCSRRSVMSLNDCNPSPSHEYGTSISLRLTGPSPCNVLHVDHEKDFVDATLA